MNTKDEALTALEANRQDFLRKCRWIAKCVARENPFRHATIDDIRERVKLPEGMDGRVFGAVFNTDDWEAAGFMKSKQKINHGRPITIFRLKDGARLIPSLPPAFPSKPKQTNQQLFA